MAYEIQNVDTNEVLSRDMTIEQVDAWWAEHGDEFFGVRVNGNIIEVCFAPE